MKRVCAISQTPPLLIRKILSGVLSVAILFGLMPTIGSKMAFALPHGGKVTKGGATLSYSTSKLLVNQATSAASFSWSSYNVKSGQSVIYKTPGSSSVSLNFIGGTTPSQIMGTVKSNGILEFMNANGIIFGQGSTVSAAGVRAFGSATPWASPTGPVTNAGTITVSGGGTAALVGSSVSNSGTINVPGGTIVLAAGSTVTPIQKSDTSSISAVTTTGGGAVTDSGVLSAETDGSQTGQIILQSGMDSGTTTLSSPAIIDASAPNGGNGGRVVINGSEVVLDNATPINVSAPYGTPGTVTIDPNLILSGTTLDVCNATGLESIDGSQSSLTINTTTTTPLSDTIILEANLNLGNYTWSPLGNASNNFTGTFNGNGYTVSEYTITATDSNGTGFIGYLGSAGKVENLGVNGTVTGGSFNNVGGIVGNNAGTITTSFNTGAVSGTGNNVGGIAGNNSGTISSSYNTGAVSGSQYVGGIAGYNTGSISSSYNTGAVSGTGTNVGGIVGYNTDTISSSYNTGVVSGTGTNVGGAVGDNSGTVTDSYWNTTTSKTTVGIGGGTTTGANGLSGSDFKNSSNFTGTGWTFATWNSSTYFSSGTWFMGSDAPLLVADIPVITLTGVSGSSTYNGLSVTPGATDSVSMGGSLNGIPAPSSDSVGPDAGTYTVTPILGTTLSQPTTQSSLGSISSVNGTYTITPANLTLNFNNTSIDKVFDGTSSTPSLTSGGASPYMLLTGFQNGESATFTGQGTFMDNGSPVPNAGNGYTVQTTVSKSDFTAGSASFKLSNYTVNNATLTGSSPGSFTLTSNPATNATAYINSLDLTAQANAVTTTYGTIPTNFTGTLTPTNSTISNSTLSSLVGAVWATSAVATSDANKSYPINATLIPAQGFTQNDFTLTQASTNSQALTVNQAPLILTLNSPVNKSYDGTYLAYLNYTPNGTSNNVTISGFKNGENATFTNNTGFYYSTSLGTGIFSGFAYGVGGPYGISSTAQSINFTNPISGFKLSNYTYTTSLSGTGNITPANLKITINNPTKIYDGTSNAYLTSTNETVTQNGVTQTFAPNLTITGFVAGDSATLQVTGAYSLLNGGQTANAGTGYNVSANVTASDFSSPSIASNYLVNGVNLSGSNPVTITGTGGLIKQEPLTLTLNTASPLSKSYDGTSTAYLTSKTEQITTNGVTQTIGQNVTLSGIVTGESLIFQGTGTFSTGTSTSTAPNVGTGYTVSIPTQIPSSDYTVGSGTNLSNYALPANFPTTATTGSINPAPLTLTLAPTFNKTYDASPNAYVVSTTTPETTNGLTQNVAPNITVSGFADGNGASFSTDGTYSSGGTAVSNVGNGYTVSIPVDAGSFIPTNGTSLSNYSVNGVRLGSGTANLNSVGNITPAQLTLSTTATKIFDGNAAITLTPTNTTLSGMVSSQTPGAGLDTTLPGNISGSAIGSSLEGTISLSLSDLTGDPAFLSALATGNYIIPTTFTGGAIMAMDSSPIVPAAQADSSNLILSQSELQRSRRASNVTLPSFRAFSSTRFGSNSVGGVSLNTGALTADSSKIFNLKSKEQILSSESPVEPIYTIDSNYIFPVQESSKSQELSPLEERTPSASSSNRPSSSNQEKSLGEKPFNTFLVTGSTQAPFSLQVPHLKESSGRVFESDESQ